jgi:hypothetical protein
MGIGVLAGTTTAVTAIGTTAGVGLGTSITVLALLGPIGWACIGVGVIGSLTSGLLIGSAVTATTVIGGNVDL